MEACDRGAGRVWGHVVGGGGYMVGGQAYVMEGDIGQGWGMWHGVGHVAGCRGMWQGVEACHKG